MTSSSGKPTLDPQVEAEVNATIKLVLSVLEQAAREHAQVALDPVTFNERRRAVIRRVWHLARLAAERGV